MHVAAASIPVPRGFTQNGGVNRGTTCTKFAVHMTMIPGIFQRSTPPKASIRIS